MTSEELTDFATRYSAAWCSQKPDSLETTGAAIRYHWTLRGTNTGPGGTGRPVHISGYEEWTFGPDRLIVRSLGHFDEAEYQRQIHGTPGTTS